MPGRVLSRIGQTLFIVQCMIAFGIFLLASQREAFHWAGRVTSVGLALWTIIGVPLLVIYGRLLRQ
ncbi:hypothetical protein F5883DRAFT_553895 [Diaporthe sp. PMI_573]|nr:hypothetical protein F5883DRAFT_553895 [Diaporthaceae sp. PMI_573]